MSTPAPRTRSASLSTAHNNLSLQPPHHGTIRLIGSLVRMGWKLLILLRKFGLELGLFEWCCVYLLAV